MNDREFKKHYRKNLAFKPSKKKLNEGSTWETRKSGEPLPTMKDYKEAYENKNPKINENDYLNMFVQPIPDAVPIFKLIDGIIDEYETMEEEADFLANIYEYVKARAEDINRTFRR